jgi:SOS-response transcriptional repressors (RecA-mediated autopeptidases)
MRESSVIKQRIIQYLDYKGISKYECYKETGLTNGVLSQKNGMSEDGILKFLSQYADINTDWLLSGKGEMLKNAKNPLLSYNPQMGVPYYNVDFIGGFDLVFNDQTIVPTYNIIFEPFAEAQFWCNVTGHSMEPQINHGDIVALKEVPSLDDILFGEMYAVVLDCARTIKTLRKADDPDKIRFIPVNKDGYDEQEFDKKRIKKVFTVLGSIRKFF